MFGISHFVFKEVSYAYQGFIYLTKNSNIVKYYCNLKYFFIYLNILSNIIYSYGGKSEFSSVMYGLLG